MQLQQLKKATADPARCMGKKDVDLQKQLNQ